MLILLSSCYYSLRRLDEGELHLHRDGSILCDARNNYKYYLNLFDIGYGNVLIVQVDVLSLKLILLSCLNPGFQ